MIASFLWLQICAAATAECHDNATPTAQNDGSNHNKVVINPESIALVYTPPISDRVQPEIKIRYVKIHCRQALFISSDKVTKNYSHTAVYRKTKNDKTDQLYCNSLYLEPGTLIVIILVPKPENNTIIGLYKFVEIYQLPTKCNITLLGSNLGYGHLKENHKITSNKTKYYTKKNDIMKTNIFLQKALKTALFHKERNRNENNNNMQFFHMHELFDIAKKEDDLCYSLNSDKKK